MTDIADSFNPIQVEGAETRAPVSESLVQSIGGAINAILKKGGHYQIFTASGTFSVPTNIKDTFMFFIGFGGGGGGGATAGGGGAGAPLGSQIDTVVPGDTLTITIGAGGLGGGQSGNPGEVAGTPGSDTTVNGSGVSITFKGGYGGGQGFTNTDGRGGKANGAGTWGGFGFGNPSYQTWDAQAAGTVTPGQDSMFFTGGAAGANAGGGGGGAGPGGAGAAGGNGSPGSAGGNASANTGAGGGGGGSPTENGGNGGSGYLVLMWFT